MSSTITTDLIMKLRNQTGAGIMDCKTALTQANGDIEKAIEILRKKGLSDLAKRANRAMKEGIVVLKANDKKVIMLELNCETDFVAKNEEFINLANTLSQEMLLKDNYNPVEDEKAKERLQAVAMKIGENMQIRRGVSYYKENGFVIGYYLHSDNKKGAIVKIRLSNTDIDLSKVEEVGRNLAMQCVAMIPRWIRKEDVPVEIIEKEKEIYKSSPQASGKSEIALSKMVEGRINKFFKEVCLLEQPYIKELKMSISEYLEKSSKEIGSDLKVEKFDVFIVGVE